MSDNYKADLLDILGKLHDAGISYENARYVVNNYVDVQKVERDVAYSLLEDVYKRI